MRPSTNRAKSVILIYLAGIIALGVWLGKDQKNTRDYFLGSRNIPWWGIGLSIVAAETSALTIIGVPALAFGGDLTFLQMVLGYVIARLVLVKMSIARDPQALAYMDSALTPVGDDNDATLDLLTKTTGAGAALAHIRKVAVLTGAQAVT